MGLGLNSDEQKVLRRFEAIKPWSKGGKRAPHKPLLILYALGQLQKGKRAIHWNEAEEPLRELFYHYGVSGLPRPEYPFIRLANDGVWEHDEVPLNKSGDAALGTMRMRNTAGRFKADILTAFDNNPELISQVTDLILSSHFPYTLHSYVENEAQVRMKRTTMQYVRDPKFREAVLYAYSGQCAVCGYNIGTKRKTVGVEAAHIKWVEHQGPDQISNGIALCANHHRLFDFGLWSLNDGLQVLVSPRAIGNESLQDYLVRFEGEPIRVPKGKNQPNPIFVKWQREEVFKGV